MSKSEYGLPASRLSCFAMAEENDKAWFVRLQANGLYEYDKLENRTKLLMYFSDFSIGKGSLYISIEKIGNILVLAPASASKIVIYDLATGKAEYLELAPVENNRKVKYNGWCNFFKSYRHEDSAYFWGWEYPALLKIDVKTKQIVYLTDWVEAVEQRIKKLSASMGYVSDFVVVGDCIWALCECANAVLCLDLQTDEIRVVDFCSDFDIRCGICFDGNFWVTGYNEKVNKLLKYNCAFELEKEIKIVSNQGDSGEYFLSLQDNIWEIYPMIDLGDRLLLFSVYPRHVYEFSKALNEVRILPAFEELLEIKDEKFHDMGILAPRKKENLICFITGNDFLWNEYDYVNDVLTRCEVKAEPDEELLRMKSEFMVGRVLGENAKPWELSYQLTLPRFLEHMTYLPKAKDIETDSSVAADIYERISKEIPVI